VSFETAIIERYLRRESSVDDTAEALWGSNVSPATEQESLRPHRELAKPPFTGWQVSVCLRG